MFGPMSIIIPCLDFSTSILRQARGDRRGEGLERGDRRGETGEGRHTVSRLVQ